MTHLLKHIALLERDSQLILDHWIDDETVKRMLCQNGLKTAFFKERFASKVIEYALGVIENKNELGQCPVIGVMLILFKKKNIPLSDVFIICVNLKNTLLHYFNDKNLLSSELLKELNLLMDHNFEGVIREYADLYYHDIYKVRHCGIENTQEDKTEELDELPVYLSVSSDITSAKVYLTETEVDMDMVAELDELERESIDAMEMSESLNTEILSDVIKLFEHYSKILNGALEFDELVYTLTVLLDMLRKTQIDLVDDLTQKTVVIYLRAVISDLQSWRMSVFITQEAEDIHYLDKTLLSSIAQLQIMLMPQEETSTDEIEFF